jgi:ankyrin repeat protein
LPVVSILLHLPTLPPTYSNHSPHSLLCCTTTHSFGKEGSAEWAASESIFKFVVERNLKELKEVSNKKSVNSKDAEGLSPLHFAADRGFADVAEELLSRGADVNAVDASGQTALMYAVSCEQAEVMAVLLRAGADCALRDEDEQSVFDFEGVPEPIAALLAPHKK